MSADLRPADDHRPGGRQFSLRGMFLLITAMSVIFAVLSLVLKTPRQWLGALALPFICVSIIAAMEFFRAVFPPQPRYPSRLPPPPTKSFQAGYFQNGQNPFGQNAAERPIDREEPRSPFRQ